MTQYVISRPIGGISLNGKEYVLDDDGGVRKFDSVEAALTLLDAPDREELESEGVFIEEYECPTCGREDYRCDCLPKCEGCGYLEVSCTCDEVEDDA